MKLSETTLTINKQGNLKVPALMLREMGLRPGDHVRLAYFTHDGCTNIFQEFLLSAGQSDGTDGGDKAVSIPNHLLQQAAIPSDADLQIVCLHGYLIICQDTALQPEEPLTILESLRLADDLTAALPHDTQQAYQQLEATIQSIQEGRDIYG